MADFTVEGIENIVRDWLQTITGIPFYFLDSNVTRPNGLYGSLKNMTDISLGTPAEKFTDETISGEPWSLHEVDTQRTVTFSVNAYRAGARDVLKNVISGYWLNIPQEILSNGNIGNPQFSARRDLTTIVEGQREERAQMDITFYTVGSATESLNTIQIIPINGSVT